MLVVSLLRAHSGVEEAVSTLLEHDEDAELWGSLPGLWRRRGRAPSHHRHTSHSTLSARHRAGAGGQPTGAFAQRVAQPMMRLVGAGERGIVALFEENPRPSLAGEELLDRVHPSLLY